MLPRPIARRVHRATNALVQRGWARLRVAGAIAPGTVAAERFGSFGEGSIMGFPTAVLYGERNIHVGSNTTINTWVTLSAGYHPDQDTVPPRCLVVGDRCVIGLRSGIVAHESIEIGDDVWFGQEVYVTDANHGYSDPDTPIGKQLGKHEPVSIGSGTWIGHGAVVLPGSRIGRNVVVAAGSVVRGDIPDHAVVGGVPAKVIRRLVPGRGWVRAGDADDTPDVKATSPTIDPSLLAEALEQLERETRAEEAVADPPVPEPVSPAARPDR